LKYYTLNFASLLTVPHLALHAFFFYPLTFNAVTDPLFTSENRTRISTSLVRQKYFSGLVK